MIGIEFAYAAETAFVTPILLKIGIEHKVYLIILYCPILISRVTYNNIYST